VSPSRANATGGGDLSPVLERARAGDRAAQAEILRAELPALERFLSRFCRRPSELEDLVQRTLVRAVSGFGSFRGESSVGTWLARIGTRLVMDDVRASRRRGTAHLRLATEQDRAAHEDVERRIDARRLLDRAHALLEELPAAQRVAFVLHAIEGRPVAEVAALMGSSSVTTRARVFWARRRLAARLVGEGSLADALAGAGTREDGS
jgi:RNA polymerase sigma-70 factor (ECF subfamily)